MIAFRSVLFNTLFYLNLILQMIIMTPAYFLLPRKKALRATEANRARFTISSTPGEGTLVEVAFPSTRVLAE